MGAAGGLTYNKDSNLLTVLGTVSAQGNVYAGSVLLNGNLINRITTTHNIKKTNISIFIILFFNYYLLIFFPLSLLTFSFSSFHLF